MEKTTVIRRGNSALISKFHPDIYELKRFYSFDNPAYKHAVKTYARTNVPKYVEFFRTSKDKPGYYVFPDTAFPFMQAKEIEFEEKVEYDGYNDIKKVEPFKFLGKIRDYQEEAVDRMLMNNKAFVRMPTGSGKTVTMLYLISKLSEKTLVIVHTKELLYQWQERIKQFLDFDAGQIGAGKKEIKDITVAINKSLNTELINQFSMVVVDEAHHVSANNYFELLLSYTGYHLYGCSATETTSNKMNALTLVFGYKAFEILEKQMIEEKAIIKPDYYVIKTPFQVGYDGSQPYIKMITKLVENQERNLLICSLITSLIDKDAGRSILILSPYVKHCETLSNILNKYNYKNSIITGNLHKDIRKEQIEQFKRKETNILIATTIADEGLDIPHIDTLVLACPTKFEGRMLQRVGRILRPSKGKTTAEVYDFYEHTEGLFIGQFNTRSKTMLEYFGIDKFKALDYSVSGV